VITIKEGKALFFVVKIIVRVLDFLYKNAIKKLTKI